MSFAVPLSDKNPQTVWGEQEELGGRIILTIPFGSKVDDVYDGTLKHQRTYKLKERNKTILVSSFENA